MQSLKGILIISLIIIAVLSWLEDSLGYHKFSRIVFLYPKNGKITMWIERFPNLYMPYYIIEFILFIAMLILIVIIYPNGFSYPRDILLEFLILVFLFEYLLSFLTNGKTERTLRDVRLLRRSVSVGYVGYLKTPAKVYLNSPFLVEIKLREIGVMNVNEHRVTTNSENANPHFLADIWIGARLKPIESDAIEVGNLSIQKAKMGAHKINFSWVLRFKESGNQIVNLEFFSIEDGVEKCLEKTTLNFKVVCIDNLSFGEVRHIGILLTTLAIIGVLSDILSVIMSFL